MKKMRSIWTMILLFSLHSLHADEGMWLPILLKSIEGDMRAAGLKLSAEDIYSVNKSSLKDAIVLFGGGCTGEIVSSEGLLFTNHHCGFSQIQAHSDINHDYITNGFWAMKRDQELSNPGLEVTFIVRMEDVTKKALEGVNEKLSETRRAEVIKQNIAAITASATKESHQNAMVRAFYYGNEYYMFITETYKDVRLVGAPPQSIGNFGGDTDNWVWPRHTADFSVFRVYMSPEGKPAEYNKNNVPYKPKHFFPVNLKGVEQGDFTMVYGFPGRTQEYLVSQSVEVVMNVEDPARVKIRDERLRIMKEEMVKNDTVRIQYASKYAGVANGWKKWKGEMRGLKRASAIEKKQTYEKAFGSTVDRENKYSDYRNILKTYQSLYQDYKPMKREQVYFSEVFNGMECVQLARGISNIFAVQTASVRQGEVQKLQTNLDAIFKDYSPKVDKRIMKQLLTLYREGLDKKRLPDVFSLIDSKYEGNIEKYVDDIFPKSMFTDKERYKAMLGNFDENAIKNDGIFQLSKSMVDWYNEKIYNYITKTDISIDSLNRCYMQAQRNVMVKRKFYPDANSTLRVTYGKVEGFKPDDGMTYEYYTTLSGIFQKHDTDPNNADYKYPERLGSLYERRDFGGYSKNGEIRTCFLASNHTSGGNSGSPVIDANGNLIGINFDRCWEGTMSDINYDVTQCRNISVDIRYVLFIIDKYAGAGYLLNEMKLIK
ncbi:MAG: S46 family peptidase [Bacteroidia bacterium]